MTTKSVSEKWQLGKAYMQKGDLGNAIQLLHAASQEAPEHAGVWMSFGLALCSAGAVDQGCVAFARSRVCSAEGDTAASRYTSSMVANNLHTAAIKHNLFPTSLLQYLNDTTHRTALITALCNACDEPCDVLRITVLNPSGAAPAILTTLRALGEQTPGRFSQHIGAVELTIRFNSVLMHHIEETVAPPPGLWAEVNGVSLEVYDSHEESSDEEEEERKGVVRCATLHGAVSYPFMLRQMKGEGEMVFPSNVAVYGCIVSSTTLRELNFVDSAAVEMRTGIQHIEHIEAGLHSTCRCVRAGSHSIETHSVVQKLSDLSTSTALYEITMERDLPNADGMLIWESTTPCDNIPNRGLADYRWEYMLYFKRRDLVAGEKVVMKVVRDLEKRQITATEEGVECVDAVDARLPLYHAAMLNDHNRTVAYRDGLAQIFQQMVEATSAEEAAKATVLDLGCGTGFLSLLASKAGFSNITAVERFPEIGRIAETMFKRNNQNVNLLLKHSADLSVGPDRSQMPENVSLFVHEIFGTDPLSEGLLGVYNNLVQRKVVTQRTVCCPSNFKIKAVLITSKTIAESVHGSACVVPRKLELDVTQVKDVKMISDTVEVWDVALNGEPIAAAGAKEVSFKGNGEEAEPASLVLYWFDYLCGASWDTTDPFADHNGVARTHWLHNVEVFTHPVTPSDGEYKVQMRWATDRVMFMPM